MGLPAKKISRDSFESLSPFVEQAKKGDQKAIGYLIEQTQDRLYGFFVYLSGNTQLAEDLCQETYLRAFEKIKTLKDSDRFWSWLMKTGKNLFLDHVRSPRNASYAPIESTPEASLPKVYQNTGVRADVQKALSCLDQEEKVALLLVDLEAHSYEEAAEIIGITEAALRSRLHRARQHFIKRYRKK